MSPSINLCSYVGLNRLAAAGCTPQIDRATRQINQILGRSYSVNNSVTLSQSRRKKYCQSLGSWNNTEAT
jgi:hypothetical protein